MKKEMGFDKKGFGDPEEKVPAQGTSQLLCVPRDVSVCCGGVWALRRDMEL